MQRSDSFEKTLMLGKIEGGRSRGWQRMRWFDGIADSMDMGLSKLWELVMDGESLACCSPWGCQELDTTEQLNWTDWWAMFIPFSSVAQLCPTHCDPMNRSTPGLPVHYQLPELTQTHVHWVGDAIQPSHPLSSPSPPAFNLSQHQSLFQWLSCSHQVAKVLEFQLQHQSFQWTLRTDFL